MTWRPSGRERRSKFRATNQTRWRLNVCRFSASMSRETAASAISRSVLRGTRRVGLLPGTPWAEFPHAAVGDGPGRGIGGHQCCRDDPDDAQNTEGNGASQATGRGSWHRAGGRCAGPQPGADGKHLGFEAGNCCAARRRSMAVVEEAVKTPDRPLALTAQAVPGSKAAQMINKPVAIKATPPLREPSG